MKQYQRELHDWDSRGFSYNNINCFSAEAGFFPGYRQHWNSAYTPL